MKDKDKKDKEVREIPTIERGNYESLEHAKSHCSACCYVIGALNFWSCISQL